MFAVKPWKEFAMRALLSSVILFNALTPIGVSISKAEGENESAGSINSNNDIKNGITLGNPLPQRAEKVPVLADQITKQAQGQQEEKPVRFKATAEPAIFTPGKPVNLRWQVQNMKTEDQQKAEVVIHAPEGLMPADPNPTYVQDGLITVPLQDKKDSSAWNVSEGAELPIYFELDLLVNDDFIASETVMVDQAHFSVEKNKGGKLKGLGGKVELDVPANVTDESLDLDIREPAPQSQPGTSLTWQPLEIIAVGQNSQKDIHQFKAPLKLTLRYDETQIFDWDENALTIYYYDPDVSDWFQIETSVDSKNNTLTAYTNHLTVFDYKANNWQSHMAPTVDDFKVADFTGAGTYAINLWTPPGPDGLQPNLTLSYNSQVIDDSTAFTQASWVGMGWDLDTGAVLHNLHGTDQDFSDDTFSISAGGVSGLLLPIGYDGNITTYNTADQSFLKVQGNDADYTFTAWGKNGTKYFFAQKDTSNVNVNNGCPTKTDVTWRWSLSSVTDIHANTITYTNENETKANCTANQIAVYPKTITYGKYQIVFETEARTDYQTSWTSPDSRTLYGTQRLHQVMIKENGVPIRSYVFSYAPDTAATNVIYPNFNWSNQDAKTLTLVGIQVFAGDGNDPSASALPAVTFTYVDGMHLTDVDNGQGGQVHIGYERWNYLDDINKDARSLRTNFGSGGNECYNSTQNTVSWIRVSGSGVVRCDLSTGYMQVGGSGATPTTAVAEHAIPEYLMKLGAEYWYHVQVRSIAGTETFKWGMKDTTPGATALQMLPDQSVGMVSGGQVFENNISLPSTFNPSKTQLHLECRYCYFKDIQFSLKPLIYRVISRTIHALPGDPGSSYTYNYDNASPSTIENSLSGFFYPTYPVYSKPMLEFRGHAMTQAINPEGLATVNWFYQNDSLKGRAYDTLVLKQDFYDPMESPNEDWVKSTAGTLTFSQTPQTHFDNAAQLYNSSGVEEVSFSRASATLTSGEMAVAHVRLDTSGPVIGKVGLVNNSGQFFGITLSFGTATASDGTTLLDYTDFLHPFRPEKWFGVMFFVDAVNGSRLRIWQLDNPSIFAERVIPGVGAGAWTFLDSVSWGTIYLDSYFEGMPYTEEITRYSTTVMNDNEDKTFAPPLIGLTTYRDLKVVWNAVASMEQRNYNGDAKFVGTKRTFTYAFKTIGRDQYPEYGNLLTETDYAGNNDTWSIYRGIKYEYFPNSTTWVLSLPARQVILDCTSGVCDFTNLTGKQAETYFFYDGAISYTTPPTKGDLTKQRTWVKDNDYGQASFTYYDNGNLKDQIAYTGYATAAQTDDPSGAQTTTTVYDSDGYNTYPVLVINPLGQVTQTTYDYRFGLPNSVTDPNGEATTISAAYDEFGRLQKIAAAGHSLNAPTLQVTYCDTCIPFQADLVQVVDADASIHLSRFYDGAGRQIQTQTVGAVVDGTLKNIVTDSLYDNLGRLIEQSVPNPVTYDSTPTFVTQNFTSATTAVYDLLGRILSVTQPNQDSVTYTYEDLSTTVTDPKLVSTTTTMDVWGRATLVDAPEGPDVTYTYDVLNQLKTVMRGGLTTTINYDAAGRKLDMTDPDMGFWQYQYDALGNLILQIDNRSCALNLAHDGLNRLTGKTSSGEGCNQQVDSRYYYDSDNPTTPGYDPTQTNQNGYRTYMADASGSTAWVYDPRGRLVTESKIIDDQTYSTSWAYNSADLPVTLTYPDGEVLTYRYNTDSSLNSVSSNLVDPLTGLGQTYLAGTKYDEAGRIISMDYGASILRKMFNYFPWKTDEQGGLLNTTTSTRLSDNATLQNFAYTYDKNANVATILDNQAGPQTQTFGYDSLNRLTSAAVSGGTNGLYSETYQYNPTSGNLSLKSGLTYSYTDPSHAHAVTSAGSNTYAYDANGNMTRRIVEAQTFDLAYDAENRLVSVVGNGTPPPTATSTVTQAPGSTPTLTSTGQPGGPTATLASTSVVPPTPGPGDPYTVALLHMNGTDGEIIFPDETARVWTRHGNAQVDTAQSRFGGASLLADGNGDYLTTPHHSDFDISGDFTLDFWTRFNSTSGTQIFLYKDDGVGGWYLFWDPAAGSLRFQNYAGSVKTISVSRSWSPNTGQWYHIALVRSGSSYLVFVNGAQLGTPSTDTDPVTNTTASLTIGASSGGTSSSNAWLDEVRFSNGVARWTNDFTPPATEYGVTPPIPTQTPTETNTPTVTDTSGGATAIQTATQTPTATLTSTTQACSSTYTSQPDAATGKDIYISSDSPGNNHETDIDISIGEDNTAANDYRRGLIQFDLSSIPGNATICSANLSLFVNSGAGASNDRLVRVYRLKTAWSEETGTWNAASISVNWQTSGASGANDRENTDIGSLLVPGSAAGGSEQRWSLDPAKIQEMVNGTFANNGFLLQPDTEQDDLLSYYSSDYSGSPDRRPKLAIQYSVPQGRAPLSSPALVGGKAGGHFAGYHFVSPQQSESLTFISSDDAYIYQANGSMNYGSATTLETDNSPERNFLLKFNVTGINGQQVTNAKIRLYSVDTSDQGGNFYRVSDNSWQEETVTWNNAPTADSTVLAALGSVSMNAWYELDVTSLVTGDGTYSLRISSTSSDGAYYSSKEGVNPPQLVVTLGGSPEPSLTPTNMPLLTATNAPGSSPTVTNAAAPTITLTSAATTPPLFSSSTFVYDGDGKRVKSTLNGTVTTHFVGNYYEVTGSTIIKYYYAGAQRIALRNDVGLFYLLSDHLGSTSLVTDATGHMVSELRYKAWGEVRYSSSNYPTNYTYTGQYSNANDFGLMFYNARWYDPVLGRFVQADNIVPGGANTKIWDRYSYVTNNPIQYNDPTGHRPCAGVTSAECKTGYTIKDQIDDLQLEIKARFNWNVEGDGWTVQGLETIYEAGSDIEKYVDDLTGGNGLAWMNAYLSGVTFTLTNADRGQTPDPNSIILPSRLFDPGANFDPGFAKYYIAHELGHVWDFHTGEDSWRGPVGGVGDMLNDFIGGKLHWWNSRVYNPDNPNYYSPLVPEAARWKSPHYYGNGSTADYLAEAFVYSVNGGDVPLLASLWVPTIITLETNAIP